MGRAPIYPPPLPLHSTRLLYPQWLWAREPEYPTGNALGMFLPLPGDLDLSLNFPICPVRTDRHEIKGP